MDNDFLISPIVDNYIKVNKPQVAIIAPTLDTVPSLFGNAIYCLIEDIAFYSKYPVVVFSVYSSNLPKSKIEDRIIYYKPILKKTFFQKLIGHRGRKLLYGISRTEDISYSKSVLNLCLHIGIKCLVIEDANSLLPGLQRKNRISLVLHQHINALTNHKDYIFAKLIRQISEIIFVSHNSIQENIRNRKTNAQLTVIYNGVDINNYKICSDIIETTPANKTVLLYVGRIHKSKGVLELIRAVGHFENLVLYVVGDLNTTFDFDKQYVNEIKSASSVNTFLVGNVSQTEIFKYYSMCDFVVVPSIGPEGLPKVVTEAVIMGKPVIASNRGGTNELIIENINGIIINEPVCSETIITAIERAIKIKDDLKKNALNNIEQKRLKFSSQNMANEFDQVFRKYI